MIQKIGIRRRANGTSRQLHCAAGPAAISSGAGARPKPICSATKPISRTLKTNLPRYTQLFQKYSISEIDEINESEPGQRLSAECPPMTKLVDLQ